MLLSFTPAGKQDIERAKTLNNMAHGPADDRRALRPTPKRWRRQRNYFKKRLKSSSAKGRPIWAAAQNNIGTVLLELGQRESDPNDCCKRPLRLSAPRWGNVIAPRCRSTGPRRRTTSALRSSHLGDAKLASNGSSRPKPPIASRSRNTRARQRRSNGRWCQNNLGNTLNALGAAKKRRRHCSRQAADAFRACAGSEDTRAPAAAMGRKPAEPRWQPQ